MECLLVIAALAVLALLVASPVVAYVALSGLRRAERRIAELDLAVSRLARGTLSARAPAPAATPEPPAAEPGPTAAAPEPPPPPPPEPPRPSEPPPAPVPPPVSTSPPPPPVAERPPIDWERWIGVRGAAVLGGILFALAGIFFVRYAVESGWLAPPVRVALGVLAGFGVVIGSEVLRRRGYGPTADALAGGGVVVLYASIWAARMLYGLVPALAAFGLMAVVTAAAIALAWRHRSLVVALLGLAGGFATPLLLDTEADRPFGLFGYLLLLDLGLLLLARRRRLPALGLLGLLATLFYQALWIGAEMDPGELPIALGVLVLFGALFAGATVVAARDDVDGGALPDEPLWTRAVAVLAPFGFALYLAARADLGAHLWPVAALLALLSAAALVLDRRFAAPGAPPFLGVGAAAGSVAVVAVWALRTDWRALAGTLAWELAGICLALALLYHLFGEWELRRGASSEDAHSHWRTVAHLLPAAGFLVLLAARPLESGGVEWIAWAPWVLGPLGLAALLIRQARFPEVERRPAVAAAIAGLSLPTLHVLHHGNAGFAGPALHYGTLLAAGVALQLVAAWVARARGEREAEEPLWTAALALPFAALVGLFGETVSPEAASASPLGGALFFGLTMALAVLALAAATRLRSGAPVLGTTGLVAALHLAWVVPRTGAPGAEGAGTALAGTAAAALLFTAWPFLAGRRLDGRPAAWWAAALAGPLGFLALRAAWLDRFGDGAIGLLPVLLGALSLAAAFWVKARWPAGDEATRERRLSGLVWFGAVALGFAALAVPLQLEEEWITIAWALEGVAVIALWRRLDHPGLKWFGLALLAAVTARLVLNPEVAGYHPRSGVPIVNWLLYTYLVPAAALVASALLLARHERERARAWEGIYRSRRWARPWGSLATGAAAIAVIFVWINLTVFDLFSTGPELSFEIDRTMARDLTLSLAWALYALVLLALGFARGGRGLRGVGLGLLTMTVVKVFLYDLAGLEDLYRVASLAGLALSLVLVSLAYQRFVFRDARTAAPSEEP